MLETVFRCSLRCVLMQEENWKVSVPFLDPHLARVPVSSLHATFTSTHVMLFLFYICLRLLLWFNSTNRIILTTRAPLFVDVRRKSALVYPQYHKILTTCTLFLYVVRRASQHSKCISVAQFEIPLGINCSVLLRISRCSVSTRTNCNYWHKFSPIEEGAN